MIRGRIIDSIMVVTIILVIFCVSNTVPAQSVGTVEVYCPPMPVLKKGIGLWQAQLEPCEVTITFPDGKMGGGQAVIPPTYVRGIFIRNVDPCVCEGTFKDGSVFSINLPKEPVVYKKGRIVAVAITAIGTVTMKNGEIWDVVVRFPDCPTRATGLRSRLADEVTAKGTIVLRRPEVFKTPKQANP